MDFSTFAKKLYPIIGTDSKNAPDFTEKLFMNLLNDDGLEIIKNYNSTSFKAYYHGSNTISGLAKKIYNKIEEGKFESFLFRIGANAYPELKDEFKDFLPEILPDDTPIENQLPALIEIIFVSIVKDAKKPRTKNNSNIEPIVQDNTSDSEPIDQDNLSDSEPIDQDNLSDPEPTDQDSLSDSEPTDQNNPSDSEPTDQDNPSDSEPTDHSIFSELVLLEEFRTDCNEILLYIIRHDPASVPIDCNLPYNICSLTDKWTFPPTRISVENSSNKGFIHEVLNTLAEYTKYLDEPYLHFLPNVDALFFRNGSLEEGERLRNELQPETERLCKKITALYDELHNLIYDLTQKTNAQHKQSQEAEG